MHLQSTPGSGKSRIFNGDRITGIHQQTTNQVAVSFRLRENYDLVGGAIGATCPAQISGYCLAQRQETKRVVGVVQQFRSR